jgi:ATP-binding protein involved in chromosome partitioning
MSDDALQRIEAVLREFPDPETGRSVRQMDQVRDIRLDGDRLSLTLALTTHSAPLWEETQKELEVVLRRRLPEVREIRIQVVEHERLPEKLGQIGLSAKTVIAVGSGKGGVGKSTVAACLALGLKRSGSVVVLMDADVYGPSIPHLLGARGRPEILNNRIQPIQIDGLKVMSMGFLVAADEAIVWRGPMLHGAITQFLRDTDWGHLDYLIIDMPPGTGDIALSLSQVLPLSGAVVVCTPQDVALLDAVKAVAMFRKVNIPILGMVENMSYFVCPDTGKRYDIFGTGGARRRAEELSIPFLGEVPIQIPIRERGDAGKTTANFEDEQSAVYFQAICHNLVKVLSDQQRKKPALPKLSVI